MNAFFAKVAATALLYWNHSRLGGDSTFVFISAIAFLALVDASISGQNEGRLEGLGEQLQCLGRGLFRMGGLPFYSAVITVSLLASPAAVGGPHTAEGNCGSCSATGTAVQTASTGCACKSKTVSNTQVKYNPVRQQPTVAQLRNPIPVERQFNSPARSATPPGTITKPASPRQAKAPGFSVARPQVVVPQPVITPSGTNTPPPP